MRGWIMKLEAAKPLIAGALGRMNSLYGATVFDEWVVVTLHAGRSGILTYSGLRAESINGTSPPTSGRCGAR